MNMTTNHRRLLCAAACLAAAMIAGAAPALGQTPDGQDYLAAVRAYADAMIEHGRDSYGEVHSPLFAAALDRENMKPGKFAGIEGIRGGDRATTGANPMHDENLYQLLYALTEATGDRRYATEADKSLKWFFENCQSPATGLMAWGEHIGWDFLGERICGNDGAHEFFRPWVLWDRVWKLTPKAADSFARGLWEHQIRDHKSGEFSRHARWSAHGPGTNNEYPRHGGFYILTWAQAYGRTNDPVYLTAIETLVDMYNRLSSKKTGMIPCSSNPSRAGIVWPESNLSLAIDLWTGAEMVPDDLAAKMRARATKTDELYQKLAHDFSPDGVGFVSGCNADTLEAFTSGNWTHTQPWATRYGAWTDAQVAMFNYLRWQQLPEGTRKAGYRKLLLASADRYLTSMPDLNRTIYPGSLGDVVFHVLTAFEITGEKKFLARADEFAGLATEHFLSGDSPLPKASSRHDHYEAITRGDTLMMALLKLWQAKHRPDLELSLIYSDR